MDWFLSRIFSCALLVLQLRGLGRDDAVSVVFIRQPLVCLVKEIRLASRLKPIPLRPLPFFRKGKIKKRPPAASARGRSNLFKKIKVGVVFF